MNPETGLLLQRRARSRCVRRGRQTCPPPPEPGPRATHLARPLSARQSPLACRLQGKHGAPVATKPRQPNFVFNFERLAALNYCTVLPYLTRRSTTIMSKPEGKVAIHEWDDERTLVVPASHRALSQQV